MTDATPTPRWADSSRGLGRVIERLIGIGLLRRPLFFQARQLIIRTAERNGIPWRKRRSELRMAAEPLVLSSATPGLSPPDYYRFDSMPMSRAISAGSRSGSGTGHRCHGPAGWLDELSPIEAQNVCVMPSEALEPLLQALRQVLDLGCSVGVSTLALARWLNRRAAQNGLPRPGGRARPLRTCSPWPGWGRGRIISGGAMLPPRTQASGRFAGRSASSSSAMSCSAGHPCRAGGSGPIAPPRRCPCDGGSGSHLLVLQRLPAAVATLLKSTEPYIEDYFRLDMPAALERAGFQDLQVSACDPRHRVIACLR